ncbi:hypothetical protein N7488_010813 [Penicillium malachiteum]|nr:hypothetical protein N7488_010813 [Penicillium malachiteum]
MLGRTSGPATRTARQQVQRKARFINSRFQSTASGADPAGSSPVLMGGLAGGVVAFATGYAWYQFSGVKTVVKTSKDLQDYANQMKAKIAEKTPEPNEAFNWLRDTAKSYAVLIPGARGYIDTVFDDFEKIRNDHGDDFDKIVKDAYTELKRLSEKEGMSMDSASKALIILQNHVKRLYDLAGDAAENVLRNHPQLEEKFGDGFKQVKEMGETYGPQAKEEADRTWQQISDIVKRGASADLAEEVKNLIQEKKKKLETLGDEAWQKGYEESKQYFEKSPKLKQIVDDNFDVLKKGNTKELWGLVKESASSGKLDDVENFIKDKADKAQKSGMIDLEKWKTVVPGGLSILSQLQSVQSVAQNKGGEAESILKETVEELLAVLKKRKEQLEKLAAEGQNESK